MDRKYVIAGMERRNTKLVNDGGEMEDIKTLRMKRDRTQ
jgi:hypothetical protein